MACNTILNRQTLTRRLIILTVITLAIFTGLFAFPFFNSGRLMIDAGLMPGDTIVVERATTAHAGDIVVAIVDDAYTVKRLATERRKFVLKPENKAYPILRPEPLEIVGVVVGSFRKYK